MGTQFLGALRDGSPLRILALGVLLLPGDAALVAVLPQPIRNVDAKLPRQLRAGDEAMVQVTILGSNGNPIEHRDLLEVVLTGADGVPRKPDAARTSKAMTIHACDT